RKVAKERAPRGAAARSLFEVIGNACRSCPQVKHPVSIAGEAVIRDGLKFVMHLTKQSAPLKIFTR
ncbi:MAG: hypothetical protein IJ685_07095, partial [Selenomonadaceae bacterium]|nr:hypothetical protein [Selenomonadaceae bacterium]